MEIIGYNILIGMELLSINGDHLVWRMANSIILMVLQLMLKMEMYIFQIKITIGYKYLIQQEVSYIHLGKKEI